MAQQFPFENDTSTTVTTTTETAAITTNGVSVNGPGQPIWIEGQVDVTSGAGTTAIVIKVRRGSGTSGTAVGDTESDSITAGNRETFSFNVKDTPGEVAGQQYTVTVTQTGATANGTINSASANIQVGSP